MGNRRVKGIKKKEKKFIYETIQNEFVFLRKVGNNNKRVFEILEEMCLLKQDSA